MHVLRPTFHLGTRIRPGKPLTLSPTHKLHPHCTPNIRYNQLKRPVDPYILPNASQSDQSSITASDQNTSTREEGDLSTLLRLALPALAIVLSDPLQSLIDSACVGRQSTIQLAALGPNTAIFNAIFQTCSFLGVATANFIAANALNAPDLSPEERHRRREKAGEQLSSGIFLALVLGVLGALILKMQGPTWLKSMGTDPAVLPLAKEYLLLRAVAFPAVLITNACQGALLGMQDTLTPMRVCIVATVLNIIGDVTLVFGFNLGVAGAAIATAGAQILAMLLILWQIKDTERRNPTLSLPLKFPVSSKNLPSLSSLRPFLNVAATLITKTVVGMVAYFAMAVAATKLGTVPAAAHQIAMQCFWFVSFFPEPLSMSAQSLIAKEATSNPQAARSWAFLLIHYGFVFGLVLAAAVAGALHFGPGAFTTDLAVIEIVQSVAPLGAIAMGICGFMMMLDGISIGSGSFRHLPVSVGLGMGVVLAILWYGLAHHGLAAVWWSLIGFYCTRVIGHGVYYAATWKRSVFNSFGR